MSAKDYLSGIRTSALLYEAKKAELDDIIRLAAPAGIRISDYENERVQVSRGHEALSVCNKIAGYLEQLGSDLSELITARRAALDIINRIESADLQLILFYRYFRLLSWNDIAERFNASTDWMYRLHGKALTAFSNIYDAEMSPEDTEPLPNI